VNLLSFFIGGWQRWLIYGALLLAYGLVAAGVGYHKGVQQLWDYKVEQLKAAIKIITKIQKEIEIVREEHVIREVEIVEVTKFVEKEAPHVPVRAACNITAGWMRYHDHAADGQDRPLEGSVDDTRDTGITEAQAARVVAENYVRYHQVANDLKACRNFVRGVAKITSEAPE